MGISSDQSSNNRRVATAEVLDELKKSISKVQEILKKTLDAQGAPEILYQASRHLTLAGGKMLRPFLVLKSCELVGGREEDALPSAAALELLHTFTLIHDDVMDNDAIRRGVPTVHAKWGLPIAIVAGDLLFSKVYEIVLGLTDRKRVSPERVLWILDRLTQATIKVCEGQILDVTFPNLEKVTENDYIVMIAKKTSELFKAAAEIGGLLGGAAPAEVERLGKFAFNAGLGFQITDDLLSLTAEEEDLGKPVGSDLREGKKTLPIIHALQHATGEKRELILKAIKRTLTPVEVSRIREILYSMGSIEYSAVVARKYIQSGIDELQRFPNNETRRVLEQFTQLLVDRKF